MPMAAMGGRGDPFSYSAIEVPTVVGLLHNILTQYPDNGQIIKELVQNAEDAGATRVEIVYFPDNERHPDASEVIQKFLQGPGLCLFNDALFSEEDWQGICRLSDSIKKNNPLQVGQFGLGFKSVFHLTDYVTIISGSQVLFMDPSEPEKKMCRSLPLDRLMEVFPDPCNHQAFHNYFNTASKSKSNFPGTLFWFPLRQTSSKISETLYTPQRLERLFESFSVEANICLTFLKSLEKIVLGRADGRKVSVTYSMQITSQAMKEMRLMRANFRQNLVKCKGSPESSLSCFYEVTLQTTVLGVTQTQLMRIFHYLPGKNDAEWMTWTGRNKEKHVPLVGVALPVLPPTAHHARGHIFSFLPLPPDPSNETSLPIQVNGAFVLSQNRRQVKWRTSESSDQEPDVIWNEDLVKTVVTRAYFELLIKQLKEVKEGRINANDWYNFLPCLQKTKGRWLYMAKEVWQGIVRLPIIATEVQGFLTPKEIITTNCLNTLRPEVAGAVKKVLCDQKLPLSSIPEHVQASLKLLGVEVMAVTPRLLRKTLLENTSCLKGDDTHQHILLYASCDQHYQDLCGLPLLPLQDNSWVPFTQNGSSSSVYLCSKREAGAFIGLEGQVARTNLSQPLCQLLRDVAQSGKTQLCQFKASEHGPNLLVLSVRYVQQYHPSQRKVEVWLREVWSVLQHVTLSTVEHIPLLPSTQPPKAEFLTPLCSPLVVQGRGNQLSTPQIEALQLLGVVVISSLPPHIKHLELPGYLFHADRHGTTLALNKVVSLGQQMTGVTKFNTMKTEQHRQAMASLIDTSSIQTSLKPFLIKIKMFKSQDTFNSKLDSCLTDVRTIAPQLIDFPVSYTEILLTPTHPQERTLALALGARELSKEELCIRALDCPLSDEDISSLVSYIIVDPQLVASSHVLQQLRNTKFVPNVAGCMCRPSDLYDPEDDDSCVLLGEILKPAIKFSIHFPLLRSLGLMKVQDMPQEKFISIIKNLEQCNLTRKDKLNKSLALLRSLNRRNDYSFICQEISRVPFVYGAYNKPSVYPKSLKWATPQQLLAPNNIKSEKYYGAIGSTSALVQCENVPVVASAFGWLKTPAVESVVQHLKNLAAAYQDDEKGQYFELAKQTYHQLTETLNTDEAIQLAALRSKCCIFTEHGFRTPEEVYIWPGEEDLNLLPYFYLLPFQLRECEKLFLHLGCEKHQYPPLLAALLSRVNVKHNDSNKAVQKEVDHDRRLVVSVLERLQHHLKDLSEPLLVPIKTLDNTLELAKIEDTAHLEGPVQWLDSDELGVKIVHECVDSSLAHALGIAPLQSFLSVGGESVMEWGQREPLTTRLRNLLHQYRDGVSILKELVQNADDAGATTIHLLYDERQNEGDRTLLLNEGMERWQGPALWFYNNALFSEDDFRNLRNIGAGIKEHQPTKIGRFGLGFCSVYNLTDVPSFVSGSSYVVFDPHMTHLGSSVKSPGMRFNFTDRRNSYMLRTLSGQFKPFNGVFNCNVQQSGTFEGTLFRLPFRSTPSEISDICYSRNDVAQLLKMFSGVLGQMLLFTQCISSISVFHLSALASSPSEMVEIFHAARTGYKSLLPHPIPGSPYTTINMQQSILELTAALFPKKKEGRLYWNGTILAETSMADISVRHSEGSTNLCGQPEGEWTTTWLTSWHSGTGSLSRLAETLGGRAFPLAGVAVPVKKGCDGWQSQLLIELPHGFYRESHFHCFLPLPVKVMLPVQINGVLEVASDRTNLLTTTEDDRHSLSWNITLAGDALVHAYLGLVNGMKVLGLSAQSNYHAAWPTKQLGACTLVEHLIKGFYHALEQEKKLELIRCSSGDWLPFANCSFLQNDFLQVPQIGEIAFEFLQTLFLSFPQKRLVRIPQQILECFSEELMLEKIITEEIFYVKYFTPHIAEDLISSNKRDQLMLYLLESEQPWLEILRPLSCIPTQPQGKLRPASDLIMPMGNLSTMFSVDDERFPSEEFICSSKASSALSKLGMNVDKLPSELILERARSVAGLSCSNCAHDRVKKLLHYMSGLTDAELNEFASLLGCEPFLPVMLKPKDWSISWHGDYSTEAEYQSCFSHKFNAPVSMRFDCPAALFLSSFKQLIGSCHLLLDQTFEREAESVLHVLKRLGVVTSSFQLPLRSVVEQLFVLSSAPPEESIVLLCHAVYTHLETYIYHAKEVSDVGSTHLSELGRLKGKKILITKCGFKETDLFAISSEINCSPDLFSLSDEGLKKYKKLMAMLGVKKTYSYESVMDVLQEKIRTFSKLALNTEQVNQVSRLVNLLFAVKKGDQLTQDLHLPDIEGYLYPTRDLCFDDGVELSSGQLQCLHPSVTLSRDMLKWLNLQTKTRKRLQLSSNRLHFGQKEPLTTRLKNILEDCPCDDGIMKELLQNADDAGATEVAFIKDFRKLPCDKLFDPQWAPLQGPSLSVFNNRGFTERDLMSIQDLGNSCKKEDPETTGQYGIGFNAVYHLTDGPSFLTRGPQVPSGETLCIFDPHCWYDPHATPEFPGVQFINLKDLRKDHPDSFLGYLESCLPEEGTLFRLPLRTSGDSLIAPTNVMSQQNIEEIVGEFKKTMPNCLLFLRNVRKISIMKVQNDGTIMNEYCVEAYKSEQLKLPSMTRKYGDMPFVRNPCHVDMVRTYYTMKLEDTQKNNSEWLIVQQQGVEKKDSLPIEVLHAFNNKALHLLPHGGIALQLGVKLPAFHSTSCFLPLPIKSGLPFSINGHFALNQSRRNLWVGPENSDPKSLWNKWLMKELLVPVALHAVKHFKAMLFTNEDHGFMTQQTYEKNMIPFYNILPLASNATSEEWKKFIYWFYEEMKMDEFPMFDSFIPDLPSESKESPVAVKTPRKSRKGFLKWHSFHASGDRFPVHFTTYIEKYRSQDMCDAEKCQAEVISDILKRVGMKISSEEMFLRLTEANPEFVCFQVTPDTALTYLKSWDEDVNDHCKLSIGNKVDNTQFLKTSNIMTLLQYVTRAKDFSSDSVDKLPLMLTEDSILSYFSEENPIFLSNFYYLLPASKDKFLSRDLIETVNEKIECFGNVVKGFSPVDFVEMLPYEQDLSGCMFRAKHPLENKQFLNSVWRFILEFLRDTHIDWKEKKQWTLQYLGDWAFYPMKEKREFLIPIKDAWQVLDTTSHAARDSVFDKLPVPHVLLEASKGSVNPYSTHKLKLATSISDPTAVLDLLYFHRESVNSCFRICNEGKKNMIQTQEILEYFGKHCSELLLDKDKIRSLQIFADTSGKLFHLMDRSVTVVDHSWLSFRELKNVCDEINILLTFKQSLYSMKLLSYIEPNCIISEKELYIKIILPNLSSFTEEIKIYYLNELLKHLPKTERELWSEDQERIVAVLKNCCFIEINGILKSANECYDHLNPVFSVMGVSNLPEAWRDEKWRHLLGFAGMVKEVSPNKFLKFASLSVHDENVEKKSKVLCTYLARHSRSFISVMPEILKKEFLLPRKCESLGGLLEHHKTKSGLVSLSEGVNPELEHIIWSTRSLLPKYAIEVARKFQRDYNEIKMDSPSVNYIVDHIKKLCDFLQKEPERSPDLVLKVMESIYEYLSNNEDPTFETLKDVPLIHIPSHSAFVSISLVVGSLEEEILPYLYKAPTYYGKFFDTMKKLGMQEKPSCDTYAKVLSIIFRNSSQKCLHPEETKSMKMAMNGLVKFPYELKNLSVPELYLPVRDETLRKSVDVYVADNTDQFSVINKTFQQHIFVGFHALKIRCDEHILKALPRGLQPKFLSECFQENLKFENMKEEYSDSHSMVQEFLKSEEFMTGVLRIIDHYKSEQNNGLTNKDRKEILAELRRVTVMQVNKITTSLKMQDEIVGERTRKFFHYMKPDGDQRSLIYYCTDINKKLFACFLNKAYNILLKKWNIEIMTEFQTLFDCVEKPHYIHVCLNDLNIKPYTCTAESFFGRIYMCDIGSYLEERFLPFLDNTSDTFFEGEIVCLKKYSSSVDMESSEKEEEEKSDGIFIIVKVMRLIERNESLNMQSTYEVNTSLEQPCLLIVKAYQLYRFVRKEINDVVFLETPPPVEENINEEELLRDIRKEVKNIWKVQNEREKRLLLKRLLFKWHPDKNLSRIDLCTRIVQYIQSLVGRLERGEHVPDEEDESQAPRTYPSQTYSQFFNSSWWHHQRNKRSHGGRPNNEQRSHGGRPNNEQRSHGGRPNNEEQRRVPRSDVREARRWYRQASWDHEVAKGMEEQVAPSWVIFICYQATEKLLLAVLFLKDMEEASKQYRHSPLSRSLTTLAQCINNHRALQLATTIQGIVGTFLQQLYPDYVSCPCDRYTRQEAIQVLECVQEMFSDLQQHFV